MHPISRHRRRNALLVSLALPLFAAGCGASGDSDGIGDLGKGDSGKASVTTRSSERPIGETPSTTEAESAFEDFDIDLDQQVRVGDFELTFSTAKVSADQYDTVTVEVPVETTNVSDETGTPLSQVRDINLEVGSAFINRVEKDLASLPGGKDGKGSLNFTITDKELDPDTIKDAVLTIGGAQENQAVVPFGSKGEAVELADVQVDLTASLDAAGTKVDFADAAASYSRNGRLMPADTASLTVEVTLSPAGVDGLGENWTGKDFSLTVPDGTSVLGDGVNAAVYPTTAPNKAMLTFDVGTPLKGTYELTLEKAEEGTPSTSFQIA